MIAAGPQFTPGPRFMIVVPDPRYERVMDHDHEGQDAACGKATRIKDRVSRGVSLLGARGFILPRVDMSTG